MPDNITLEPLPFEEAIAFFRDKLVLSDDEFFALADAARARAFTVARIARMDILMDEGPFGRLRPMIPWFVCNSRYVIS